MSHLCASYHGKCPALSSSSLEPALGAHLVAGPGEVVRPTWLLHANAHMSVCVKRCAGNLPSLSSDYITSGLRRTRHSFKIINQFSNPLRPGAGSSCYPIPFLGLLGVIH